MCIYMCAYICVSMCVLIYIYIYISSQHLKWIKKFSCPNSRKHSDFRFYDNFDERF